MKNKGYATTKSEKNLPDSDLVCEYCGKTDNQEDMRVGKTRRNGKGKVIREAAHNACRTAYKKRLKDLRQCEKNGDSTGAVLDFAASLPYTCAGAPVPIDKRQDAFSRLCTM